MCLAVPGKVIELYQVDGMKMARIDFGGVVREACMAYLPDIQVGEYTIVHVGFGLSKLDEEEAQETQQMLAEMDLLAEELPGLNQGDLSREIP
jgi:hydrogenase expression/formation protein HypC